LQCYSIWVRNLGVESSTYQKAQCVSQPLCKDHPRHHQIDINSGSSDSQPKLLLRNLVCLQQSKTSHGKRLKWLGHVGRMNEGRLPKKMLYRELKKTQSCHGTKRRCRDLVNQDLKSIEVIDNWYNLCQDRPRKGWFETCQKPGGCCGSSQRGKNTRAANIPNVTLYNVHM
jgi:hypothetical protein